MPLYSLCFTQKVDIAIWIVLRYFWKFRNMYRPQAEVRFYFNSEEKLYLSIDFML